jgi:hypothetical protein
MRGRRSAPSVPRMSPWTELGIEPAPSADAWPSGKVSLISTGNDSDDARVLAMLLARATHGTVSSSTEGVTELVAARDAHEH